jgi:hypothetical protein
MAEAGITEGCRTRAFCPSDTITRAQFAVMVVRALNLTGSPADAFSDDNGHWAETAINRLAARRAHQRLRTRPLLPEQHSDPSRGGDVLPAYPQTDQTARTRQRRAASRLPTTRRPSSDPTRGARLKSTSVGLAPSETVTLLTVVAQAVATIALGLLGASGVAKLVDPEPTTGALRAARLPASNLLTRLLATVEIVVAIARPFSRRTVRSRCSRPLYGLRPVHVWRAHPTVPTPIVWLFRTRGHPSKFIAHRLQRGGCDRPFLSPHRRHRPRRLDSPGSRTRPLRRIQHDRSGRLLPPSHPTSATHEFG